MKPGNDATFYLSLKLYSGIAGSHRSSVTNRYVDETVALYPLSHDRHRILHDLRERGVLLKSLYLGLLLG